ncbi:MAG: hypothetical protein AB1442_04390 [Nitrospirota bacterium]
MKTFFRNVNILNMLLAAGLAIFVFYSLFPLLTVQVKYALPGAVRQIEEKEEKTKEPQIPSLAEYMPVSEENLFHPERKIPVEKKEAQPLPKPEFVLYGTLVTDTVSLAYMEDLKAPRSSPGRGKRQTALRKGDSLSGFTVKEIDADKVVMIRGEEKIIVSVTDAAHPKERSAPAVTTPSTQPSPAQKGVRPPTQQPRPQPVRPTPRPGSQRYRPQTSQ